MGNEPSLPTNTSNLQFPGINIQQNTEENNIDTKTIEFSKNDVINIDFIDCGSYNLVPSTVTIFNIYHITLIIINA